MWVFPLLSVAPLGPENRPSTSFPSPSRGPGLLHYNNSEVAYFENKDLSSFLPQTP